MNHINAKGHGALITKQEKASIQSKMEANIEVPLKRLPQKPKDRTDDQHYQYAIFQMMRMDPVKRWTPAKAQSYLNKYAPLR